MERLKSGLEFIFSSYKRTAAILFIGALTLAIPITITLVGQQQDIRQRAATSPAPPCLIPQSILTQLGTSTTKSYGDVNGDGQVTSVDSSLILQFSGGLITFTPAQIEAADVNGAPSVLSSKGDVNSIDSTLILQYVAGLISTFPVCSSSPTPIVSPSGNVIAGTVYIDTNGNGAQEGGETDYPGNATIKLETGVTATQAFGTGYYFTNVASGNHTVTLTEPSGYIKTTPTSVSVTVPPTPGTFKFGIKSTGTPSSPTPRPTSTLPTPTPTRTPTPTVPPSSSLIPGCGSLGDVNGDGRINSVDQLLIQQYNAGLIPISGIIAANADVNRDGRINSVDQLLIQQYNAGLISTFTGCSSSPTPTTPPGVTSTPTPTPTPTGIPPGTSNLSVTITLTGIGVSQNPALGINNNPKRPQRNVDVTIINSGNQQVDSTTSTVNYDSATGKYRGNVNLGSNFASGSYLIKVRLDNTLRKTIPGIQNITSGQTYNAPEATLVSGDIIQDNEINLLDYNALLSCYGNKACATKIQADMNDDDKVDELDINILYAGFARRVGD